MATTDFLTAVLVGITAYYAWQNRRMVREMAASREIAVLPHLAIGWHGFATTVAAIRVSSVGAVPPLDVEVEVRFVPHDGQPGSVLTKRILTSMMPPGDTRDLLPFFEDYEPLQTMEDLAARFERIELVGTMRDITGKPHRVRDELTNLDEWRQAQIDAKVRWVDPNREKRLAQEFATVFREPTNRLTTKLNQIADEIRRIAPPED